MPKTDVCSNNSELKFLLQFFANLYTSTETDVRLGVLICFVITYYCYCLVQQTMKLLSLDQNLLCDELVTTVDLHWMADVVFY